MDPEKRSTRPGVELCSRQLMATDRAVWEIRNEKNKASVRWVLVLAIGAYLAFQPGRSAALPTSGASFLSVGYVAAVLSFALLANAAITVWLLRAARSQNLPVAFKYVTMALDFLLIALVLLPTGGSESLLYPLNYVVIVSNALRYGMGVALVGTITMNAFYLGVLAYQYYPGTHIPAFHQEALKVAGFWLVGMYTGYLSRRYEILRGEVERYQKLLAEALRKNG